MNIRWTDRLPVWVSLGLLAHLAFMLYTYSMGYFTRHESVSADADSNPQGLVSSVIADIDGNSHGLLASASDNKIRLWQQRRCISTLVSPQINVRCLSLSADGTILASGGEDHSILIWSVPEAKPIQRLLAHHQPVSQVLISPDQQWLISQSEDSTLCIWRLPAGKLVKRLPARNTGFSFSTVGKLAYCDRQANLVVIDLKTQVVLWKQPQVIGRPLFTPAGDQLGWIDTASHYSVYNIFTQQRIVTFPLGAYTNWSVDFTPDGKKLVVSKWGGAIELWDWRFAKRLTQFYAYSLMSVQKLRFDEAGRLQTAGGDSIRYWNLATHELLFSVGDGVYLKALLSWLGFWIMVTLASSYVVLVIADDPTYARYTILGILTIWSLGLLLLLDQVRSGVASWALKGLWAMASLTLLSFVLYYFSFISLVSVPFGFYFGYIYLLRRPPSDWAYSLLPLAVLLATTCLIFNSLNDILYYVKLLFG